MSFTSYGFIIFAAAVLMLYYILPRRIRWILLLVSGLVFYAFSGVKGFFFIIATLITIYTATFIIDRINSKEFDKSSFEHVEDKDIIKAAKDRFRSAQKRNAAIVTAVCVVINLALILLVRFSSLVAVLGISFYTLQSFGYLFDVKRKKYPREKNFFKLALFLTFFPQLVQGPINRYDLLSKTLYDGAEGRDKFKDISFGLLRMAWGFFKKLVIADRISIALASIVEAKGEGIYVLAAVLFYAIRLYGDFTGGIDIALGFSRALGIEMSENFERPYFSKSIAEFWRRWHITLGTWMKDYIFYPISVSKLSLKISKSARQRLGNGLGKRIPVYLSTIAVWLLTGLWHGLTANFIVWGLLNCFIILISQEFGPLYKKFKMRFPKIKGSVIYGIFETVRTFFLMGFLRMLDVYTNVGEYFSKLFGIFSNFIPDGFTFSSFGQLGLKTSDFIIVFAGCALIFAVSLINEILSKKGTSLENMLSRTGEGSSSEGRLSASALVPIAAAVLFAVVIIFGAYGRGFDIQDFIYTRF